MYSKENIGRTYYYSEFITQNEQLIIKNWSLRNEKFLIPQLSGPYRATALFESIPEKLDLLWELKNRIIELEGLVDSKGKLLREDFVSIQRNGAKICEHMDRNPLDTNFYCRRYNIFITLPEIGGKPIYDKEILNIHERCLLKVDAGLILHSTTTVEGETPRIILSYGFAIKKLSTF